LTEKNSLDILIINIGVTGNPPFTPDINRQEVAREGGGDLATLASGENEEGAMRVKAAGLAVM
jgi:uncharacterized protein (UPF0261 family)